MSDRPGLTKGRKGSLLAHVGALGQGSQHLLLGPLHEEKGQGLTERQPDQGNVSRSATASQRRSTIRKPSCGKKTKTAAVRATNSLGRGTPPSQEIGESQWKTTQS
jgi:hypothetical protein